VILFGIGGAYGLRRVAATGGVPEPVTTPDVRRSETSHRWPCFLPDGRHFLYLVLAGASSSIWAGSLGGEKRELLLDTFSAPIYAESGHLLFVRDGALRAQAFDAAALRLIGEPLTLAEPVQADTNLWAHTPVSVGGDILAYRGGRIGTVQLTWVDRGGRELGTLGPPGDYHDLAPFPRWREARDLRSGGEPPRDGGSRNQDVASIHVQAGAGHPVELVARRPVHRL
jgi:hypothetical protein